jgi:hypothetical protein
MLRLMFHAEVGTLCRGCLPLLLIEPPSLTPLSYSVDYQSVVDRLDTLKGEGKVKEYFRRMEKIEIDIPY